MRKLLAFFFAASLRGDDPFRVETSPATDPTAPAERCNSRQVSIVVFKSAPNLAVKFLQTLQKWHSFRVPSDVVLDCIFCF